VTPDEIFDKKIKTLLAAEKKMRGGVASYQRQLMELIAVEYLPLFDVKDGVVTNSAKNQRLVNSIDNIFNNLTKTLNADVLSVFAQGLIDGSKLDAQYYRGLGFKKSVVNGVIKNKVNIEATLGVTPKGRLRKTGYLFRLGETAQVRNELKQYVLNSLINSDTSFLDFQLGFRNLVIGNKRVKGKATKGSLQRYFDQFAYDQFNNIDAANNKQIATNLGLEYFIYGGSLIDTSRKFCEKRAGRAFKISDAKTWRNDVDLIDQKTKDAYKPLIERGRYRCRHWTKYTTKVVYLDYQKRGLTGLAA